MQAFVTGGSGFVGRRLVAALDERGDTVRALGGSESSARVVERAGATPVRDDLGDVDAMADGTTGCEVVFHLAAKVDEWGDPTDFERISVQGTENVISAARGGADVDRVVRASTEAVLADGSPLRNVDESHPIPDTHVGYYPRTNPVGSREPSRRPPPNCPRGPYQIEPPSGGSVPHRRSHVRGRRLRPNRVSPAQESNARSAWN